MKSVKSGNPLLPICEELVIDNESKYNLRHQLQHKVIVNTNRFKDFVTFRYAYSKLLIRVLRCTCNPAFGLQLVLINKLQTTTTTTNDI